MTIIIWAPNDVPGLFNNVRVFQVIGALNFEAPGQVPDYDEPVVELEQIKVEYSGRNASIMNMFYCARWVKSNYIYQQYTS